jgi:hypothetical protein
MTVILILLGWATLMSIGAAAVWVHAGIRKIRFPEGLPAEGPLAAPTADRASDDGGAGVDLVHAYPALHEDPVRYLVFVAEHVAIGRGGAGVSPGGGEFPALSSYLGVDRGRGWDEVLTAAVAGAAGAACGDSSARW